MGDGEEPQLSPDAWTGEAKALCGLPNYRWGIDLYNAGYYWEAHEAWEQLWRQAVAESPAHQLLQGLIQSTASALKARVQQWSACRKLADRGLDRLRQVAESNDMHHFGFDLPVFVEKFESYVTAAIGGDETNELSPPPLFLHSTH